MTILITIIVLVLVLGLCIFVHELGHFGASRLFKVGVEEFGFGYPPRIFGLKKGKTLYSLNWIPLGGFCKIKGVVGGDQEGEAEDGQDSFIGQAIWKRFVILSAGVVMNIILCAMLLSLGYMIGLPDSTEDISSKARISEEQLMISYILEDSPASQAKLKPGDIILGINNQTFSNIEELNTYNNSLENSEINLTVKRNAEQINTALTLETLEETDKKGMGVLLSQTGTVSYPWYLAIYEGTKKTFVLLVYIVQAFYYLLKDLIFAGQVSESIAGPVGIAVLTSQAAQMGFIYVLQFTALLSLNLAIFNFLPFPALDGGRVIFLIIEKIKRKPVSQKIENLAHNLGFGLLIILLILVTFRDIGKLF